MRRATAAAGGRHACSTNATHPGGDKDTRDHASARAGVRAAATPARAALAPCDILQSCRRVAIKGLRLVVAESFRFLEAVDEAGKLSRLLHPCDRPVLRLDKAMAPAL